MAQYVFFMILSLGLFLSAPNSLSHKSTKKAEKSLRVIKTEGGDNGWGKGG